MKETPVQNFQAWAQRIGRVTPRRLMKFRTRGRP